MYSTTTWNTPCIDGGVVRESHRAARLRLQRQGGGLQHMGEGQVGIAPLGLQNANGGKQARSRASKPSMRDMARIPAGCRKPRLRWPVAAPEVGPTQGPDAGDIHGCVLCSAGVPTAYEVSGGSVVGFESLDPATMRSGAMSSAQAGHGTQQGGHVRRGCCLRPKHSALSGQWPASLPPVASTTRPP